MNLNQIVNMVIRLVMRKAVNAGVNAGINRMSGKGKARRDMTPEERRQADSARKSSRQAGQVAKMGRRLTRF